MRKTLKLSFFILAFPVLTAAAGGVDPTRPPNVPASASSVNNTGGPLTLTAVFIYPNSRFAVINGQAVKQGDHLDEFIVTDIQPYTVILTGSQQHTETLQLATPVKQSTN